MNDPQTGRMVIGVLGLLALSVVIGAIVLTFADKALPDALISLGSVAVGAIAGILSRPGSDAPQAVEVVNAPASPVPVNDAGGG